MATTAAKPRGRQFQSRRTRMTFHSSPYPVPQSRRVDDPPVRARKGILVAQIEGQGLRGDGRVGEGLGREATQGPALAPRVGDEGAWGSDLMIGLDMYIGLESSSNVIMAN